MVAVISGSGLGLFGSSASYLGSAHGNAGLGRGTDRLYINSATGNLVVRSVDESLAALGLDVSLVRTYNSQGLMDDDNGDNWRLGIHQRLYGWTGTIGTAGSTVTKVFGDGSEVVYRYDEDFDAYVSTEGDGAHDTLSHSGGQWTWTDGSSRNTETYDSNGRLLATADADGNSVTYSYTGQLLTQISDSSGQQTFLDYVGNDLAAIRVVSDGQTQTLTRYYYDASHRLRQVIVDLTPNDNATSLVDLNGDGIFETVDDQAYVTTYTYDGQSKRIASITQSDGTYVAFTYENVEGTYRVKTYRTSATGASGVGTDDERLTTFNYSGAGMTAEESVLSTTGVVTTTTNYSLDPVQFPPSWSTPDVLENSPATAGDPQIVFDARGNGLAVWGQGDNVFARRYTVGTDTWGPIVTLDTTSEWVMSAPTLSIDRETGDAIVAWGEYNGVLSRVWTSSFTASSNTWSVATKLASYEGEGLYPSQLSVSISGHYAAVTWAQGTSTNRELYQVIYKHGVPSNAQLLEHSGEPVDQVQVQIDSNGNALTLWRQSDTHAERIYFNRWRDATQAYSGPTLLDTIGDGGRAPQIKFDAQGNAFALWGQWSGLQMRRFDAATNSWGAAIALQTTGEDYYNWQLAVDEQGNALVAWLAGDWGASVVYTRRFDAATGAWGTTTSLNNTAGAYHDDRFSVSISGSNAVVAWLQSNPAGTGNDAYAARFSNGTWSTPQLLETRSEEPRSLSAAVDDEGNVSVVWWQADGSAKSIFETRFDNRGHTYTVPSGATWQSIANTLYGVNSAAAGDALRLALGNPTLTTGAQLTNLPPTLSVSTTQTQTVPAYYVVQANDTWTSITQAIYGTDDWFVVEELQELLDNPPLVPGMHLAVPLVLNSTRTHVQDALGNVTTYIKDSAGRLFAVLAPEVDGRRQQTYYDYDRDGNVSVITEDPTDLNRTTTFEYDERGNLMKTRDASGTTITRTYNDNNQLLSETRYRDSDPDGFGPSTPEDSLTARYVYDSENHLRFTISAAGSVIEHRYNAAGQRVSTLTYTSQGYFEATATESELESFVESRPRERTDYTYDFRGNIETVVVWPETDWAGEGAGTPSVTRFVYDQRGLLLQTIQPRGELTPEVGDYATTFTYDGLGRLLTTTQWVWGGESRTTINDYDDADNRTVTTLDNGDNTLVTTSLYNGVGELISVTASTGQGALLGETIYTYDTAGRLRIVTDPVGVRSFVIYDAAGQKVGMVDGDGSLTEFVYDPLGQLVKTIEYADRLDAAGLALLTRDGGKVNNGFGIGDLRGSLENVPGRNPSKDRITRSVFDAAGKLAFTIDHVGAVVGYQYDGAGRVIQQTAYVNTFQVERHWDYLRPQDVEVVPNASHDRLQRHFYDNDDNLRATLDAAGYLVEYKYDPAGRLIEQIAYATPTDPLMRESDSLDDLRPPLDDTSPSRDIRTRYFYDGRGRRVGVLDGEGYLTQTIYGDSSANKDLVFLVIRHDRQLTYTDGDTFDDLKGQIQYDDPWRLTQYRYNGAGDVVKETVQAGTELAHSSTSTEFGYDLAGRLTHTTRAYEYADSRTVRVRYDALGRVTQELTAQGSALIAAGEPAETVWQQYSVTHAYDNAGRRISTTNQEGDRTVFYYDDDGRLAYTVNGEGEVQFSNYDALGRLIDTIKYDRRIATAGLNGGRVTTALTSLIVGNIDRDSHTSVTYGYVQGGEQITTSTAEGTSTTQWTDAFGDVIQREEIRATASRLHKYIYDQRGLLWQTHWDPTPGGINRTEVLQYDAFGRVISSTDQYSNTTETEYDALGRVIATVDPMDARRSTTYDAFSRQLTVTGATPGSAVSFEYDDASRKMIMTTAGRVKVTTQFNVHGQSVSVVTTDLDQTSTTEVLYEYDANGQLTRVHDVHGDRAISEFDRAGRLYRSIDGNGKITEFHYDGASRVVTKIEDVGGLNLTTEYEHYDLALGRLLRTTQPNGIVTQTQYDRDGRLSTVTVNPDGVDETVTRYEYDDVNNTTTVIQGFGTSESRATRYEFDALGRRITEIVDPYDGIDPETNLPYLKLTTRYRYDANGNLTRKIDAKENSTWYVYDDNGRLQFTIDALGGVTETTYDPDSRVVGTRRFATATTAVANWQNLDRVTTANFSVTPDNTVDRFEQTLYDLDGRAVFTVNPMGAVTHRKFDPNGNVIREVIYNADIGVITYANAGDVTTALQNEGANLTTPGAQDRVRWMTYDARNRVVFSVDGAGGVTKNVYDDADNVTQVIQFAQPFTGDASDITALNTFDTTYSTDTQRNRVTRYWYDGTNRLRFTLDAEGWLKETRYLDANRERLDITYAGRTGTFNVPAVAADANYDDLVTLIGDPDLSGATDNQKTTTNYDAAGRVASVRDSDDNTEYFGYDDVGNKIWFTNKRGSGPQDVNHTWRYQYDANGRLTKETTPPVEVMRVTSDSNGLHGTVATSTQLETVLTYDKLGNVRTRTEAANTLQARTTTYEYDALGRQTITHYPPAEVWDYTTGTVVTNSTLSSEIGYDTLGNAIYGRDVAGNYSHKGYDVLGRVTWELDALRYLTFNIYDAFGNVTETRRFNAPVDGSEGSANRPAIGYPSSPAVGAQDRVLVREYDRLNRVSKVIEPGSYVFDTNRSGGPQSGEAIPQTVFKYNAFGQVVRESHLVHGVNLGTSPPSPDADPSLWASSYSYYDRRGLKIAEVDAENYLTRYEYDETGDVTSKTEYAAKASGVSVDAVPGIPTATAASGSNRYRRYLYDELNRLVSETLDISYTDFSDLNQSPSRTGTTTLSYGYDELGNRVRVTVNNASTYSYYDALGRVVAIAEPRRVIGHTQTTGSPPTSLTPYTEMLRDAYGNVVKKIDYAGDIGFVGPTTRPTVSAALTNDSRNRVTLNRFDLHGRLVETAMAAQVDGQAVDFNNANFAVRHVAYTVRGEVARQWQTIQTVNPDTTPGAQPYLDETISTTQYYDVLGRQIRIEEPQASERARIAWTDYNAFGEVTERRMMNGNTIGVFGRETFEYDRNGRMWRTNSDTGVYRVYLYDIAGRATAEIKSKDLNLHDSTDLAAVLNLSASNLMRSESVYDLLGRVVEQRGPSFELLNSSWTVTGTGITTRNQSVDRWGNVTQVVDVEGRITDYYYDQRNNLVRAVMPYVDVLSTGLGSGIDDPNLGLPRFRPVALNYYDRDGNLIGKEIRESRNVDPLSVTPSSGGPVEQTVYNAVGQVIKEKTLDTAFIDAERKYTLDRFGQRIQSVDEEGYRARYKYDQMGNVIAVARERGAGEFDSTGFYLPTDFPTVVRSVPTAGNKVGYEVIQYAYDQAGRRISETTGEFTGTSGNQQETIRYWYDLFGNLIRKREPLGTVSLTASDGSPVVVSYETTYSYDINGKKTLEVDGNGSWMMWSYDYFGRVVFHQQLTNSNSWVASSAYGATGDEITYTYNHAGLLDYQSSVFGQRIDYQYDTAGQLRNIIDDGLQYGSGQGIRYAVNRDTNYRYNELGERVGERTIIDGLTHQNSVIEFDELGRLKSVEDLRSTVQYSYDARGNRTRVHEMYRDNTSVLRTHDDWYVYDALNRVIISQGVFWQNQGITEIRIDATQGVELTYDARGNRATSKSYGKRLALVTYLDTFMLPVTEYQEGNGIDERGYHYDGLSRLIYEWRTMDIDDLGIITVGSIEDPFSPGILADERFYDHASRQLTQITRTVGANGQLDTRSTNSTYDDNGRLQRQTTGLNNLMESDIYYGTAHYDPGYYWPGNELGDPGAYSPAGWRPGYDAAGVLRGYRVYAYPQGRQAYYTNHSFEYVLGDTYQEAKHTAESFSTNGRPEPLDGSNKRIYNINGELVSYFDPADTAGTNNRIFATNAGGQVLTSVAGNNTYQANNSGLFGPVLSHTQGSGTMARTQFYRYAGGQYIGTFGVLQTGVFAANFDTSFEPISSHYPAPAPAQVTVQTGDTLRLIAARVFGDGNLWYVLADANGLMMGPDDSLADNVGWSLRVPNEVVSITNSASTFKPFSADDALGDTTPIQPAPPPPKARKGCGVVGMILVIVVAIVATVLTAGALAGAAGSGLSTMFATGASVLAGGAPVLGVATVGSAGAFFATAAVAGAVGSAISQGVAMAIGLQDSFSWEGVAMSAVGAGIGSGMGASSFLSGASLTPTQTLMVTAATSNALTQGVGILVGAQDKFSWRSVATAAVSAPIVNRVGQAAGRFGAFAADVTKGITGSLVRAAFGGKVEEKQVFVDAFGNALGNSIVAGMVPTAPIGITAEQWQAVERELDADVRASLAANAAGIAASAEVDMRLSKNPAFSVDLAMPTVEFEVDAQPAAGANPANAANPSTINIPPPGEVITGSTDLAIKLIEKIERAYPNYTGAQINHVLRAMSGSDTPAFQKMLKMGPTAELTPRGQLTQDDLDLLAELLTHPDPTGFNPEQGLATDPSGKDVALNHVITGIAGGIARDRDIVIPYKGVPVPLLTGIGATMDNLAALTVAGDIGQFGVLTDRGDRTGAFGTFESDASFGELRGDVDGYIIGEYLSQNGRAESMNVLPARGGLTVSSLLKQYYSAGGTTDTGLSYVGRRSNFMNAFDMGRFSDVGSSVLDQSLRFSENYRRVPDVIFTRTTWSNVERNVQSGTTTFMQWLANE